MTQMKEFSAKKLKVKVYNIRREMGEAAAQEVADQIGTLLAKQEEVNMIFAAAPSQNEFLAALVHNKEIKWDRINAFHMDEYIGLSAEAPQGFGNFLKDRLFNLVQFKSVHCINSAASDAGAECERYAGLLTQYPVDIVCMGIGENGHIAFNDPHVAFFNDQEMVKIVDLDDKCRWQQVNDGCFAAIDQVPTHAITLTIPTLFNAKYVFCMVPASTKAQAVYQTIYEEVTEACPASILRTHNNAILYLDKDSASKLSPVPGEM